MVSQHKDPDRPYSFAKQKVIRETRHVRPTKPLTCWMKRTWSLFDGSDQGCDLVKEPICQITPAYGLVILKNDSEIALNKTIERLRHRGSSATETSLQFIPRDTLVTGRVHLSLPTKRFRNPLIVIS